MDMKTHPVEILLAIQEPYSIGPVRDGTVDLVIGPAPDKTGTVGLNVRFLVETPIIIISGRQSKWRCTNSVEDLANGDWVLIGTRSRIPFLQKRFLAKGVYPPEPFITADSISSVLSIVEGSD
jgi:LysR family transcriptional regulator of abg operon